MNYNYIFYAYIDADRFFFFRYRYISSFWISICDEYRENRRFKLTNQICIPSFQQYIRSFDQFEKYKVKYSLNEQWKIFSFITISAIFHLELYNDEIFASLSNQITFKRRTISFQSADTLTRLNVFGTKSITESFIREYLKRKVITSVEDLEIRVSRRGSFVDSESLTKILIQKRHLLIIQEFRLFKALGQES